MSPFKRFIYLYLPAFALLGVTLLHYNYNQIYVGESLAALPSGEYTLMGRRCIEAGIVFDYVETKPDLHFKDQELMSDWLYFDGDIDRRMIIDSEALTAIFGNKSCMVVERIKLFENANGRFSFSGTNISKVVPEGCSLSYTFHGKVYETKEFVSKKESGPALSTDLKMEHLVYKKDGLFLLYETREDDYSDYGCNKKDRLVYLLMPLK
jgi:hypothetical protein